MLDVNSVKIIEKLEQNGFQAYAVGGCVRDGIMGRKTDDYDITTSALPEQVKISLSDYKTIDTGLQHGTVTAIADGKPYEITTFRKEYGYSDSRHPDKVHFVSDLNTDLSRRDFTMNAVAYNPKEGKVDPFGGINDIRNKIIRTVGNPEERFTEDALRILRALRFSAVLGFDIENETAEAINKLAHTVKMVSPERIFTELKKLLCGENAHKVIFIYKSALEKILNVEIKVDIEKFQALPIDFSMRFTYLCGDGVMDALSFLRADNKTKKLCSLLSQSTPIPDDEYQIRAYISALGRENGEYVIKYRKILFTEDINDLSYGILNGDSCLSIGELQVNGEDIINVGINGKSVALVLKYLLDLVLKECLQNERDVLLAYLKKLDISML